jgi:hypothetical protein
LQPAAFRFVHKERIEMLGIRGESRYRRVNSPTEDPHEPPKSATGSTVRRNAAALRAANHAGACLFTQNESIRIRVAHRVVIAPLKKLG